MKNKIILFISLIISGCTSGYQDFYKPIVDVKSLNNIVHLSKDQEPMVYGTENFEQDILNLQSKNYVLVGYSSFNGSLEGEEAAKSQAKRVGASLVLIKSEYTNTQTTNSTMFLPKNETTYHSGTISSNTAYGSYSGTSTSYGTQEIPITSHQRRYDQTAYYFVKSKKEWQVGILYDDLTVEKRVKYGRNTGVHVRVVIEETPAFHANVLPGDLLIAIDDNPVININQIDKVWDNALAKKKSVILTVLRQGHEKSIELITK